jgi:4-amino-4-deoxy-L-arabinose transferase-like glycosyltransferase
LKPNTTNKNINSSSLSRIIYGSGMPNWLAAILIFLIAGLTTFIFLIFRHSKKQPSTNLNIQIQPGSEHSFHEAKGTSNLLDLQDSGISKTSFQYLEASKEALINENEKIHFDQSVQPDSTEIADESTSFLKINWPKDNPVSRWLDSLASWSLPKITIGQIKKNGYLVVGPLLAILFAYFAQGFYDFSNTAGYGIILKWPWLGALPENSRLLLGTGIYILSMITWFVTTQSINLGGSKQVENGGSESTSKRVPPILFILLVASIIFSLIAIFLFISLGESTFIQILWIISLIVFILSQVPWQNTNRVLHPLAEESPRFKWHNWLIFGLVLGVAFWLRFYQLATLPEDFHGDMGSIGLQTRDFLVGNYHSIFINWPFTGYPLMAFLPNVFTMAVFGNNLFGLQMSAVFSGLFSIFAIYLLVWRLFNSHRIATLTAIIMAINIAHIHFSRIVNNDPMPFCFFALFFLLDGLKSKRFLSFAFAGIFLGFSQQMYASGRVFLFIIGLFLMFLFIFQRQLITKNKHGLALMALGVLMAMGPSLVYNTIHLTEFTDRARQVFLFNTDVMNHLLNKYQTKSVLEVLWTQTRLSLLMFNHSSDSSTQFGFAYPMFSSLISPLILLGLAFTVRRWKQIGIFLILSWLACMTIFGGILTVDAPAWPRLIGILPAAAILIAITLDQVIEFGGKFINSKVSSVITAFIILFLVIVGWQNWQLYYSTVKENASVPAFTGRYISHFPENVTACGLITGPQLSVRETLFLAWPHKIVDVSPASFEADLNYCTGSSIVWIISPENVGRLEAIQVRWPHGVLQKHTFPTGYELTFYLVGVNPPDSSGKPIDEGPMSNFYAWLFYNSIVVLLGSIIWWFLLKRLKPPRNGLSDGRSKVTKPLCSVIQINWKSHQFSRFFRSKISELKKCWCQLVVDFKKEYDQITTFEFPKMNRKRIISAFLFIFLPILAVALAYFGQTFLDLGKNEGLHLPLQMFGFLSEDQRVGVGSLFLLVAALLWLFTTMNRKNDPARIQSQIKNSTENNQPKNNGVLHQRQSGKAFRIIGLLCTLWSILFYILIGENGLVRWLWVLGLGLFMISLFVKDKSSMVVVKDESPLFKWFHILALFGLLALAFGLRVYRLYDIPIDLSTDMAGFGVVVREYLLGIQKEIFGYSSFSISQPSISFLPYVISMKMVQNNLFGLYFATVVMGTLNILATYLFTWRLFDNHRLAFLTAAILTINPAHIEYSKITFFMDPWFFGFFALYFLIDGLKGRRIVSLALSGILTGFTLVCYPSGRAIIPMIAFLLISAWLFKRKWITDNYVFIVWIGIGVLVALGPNLVHILMNWSDYIQRAKEVSIFNEGNIAHLKFGYHTDSTWVIVWEQIKRSLLTFNYYTDRSAQFSYPYAMFNSMVSPMLILGLGMGFVRWRKPEYMFLVSSFMLIIITGGILTVNAPTWCRLVGIIPLAALLIALGIDKFINLFEKTSLKPFVPFLSLSAVLYLGVMGVMDWKYYVANVSLQPRPVVNVGRYLDTLPTNVNACGITDGFSMDQAEIVFLGWPRKLVTVPPDASILTIDTCPGPNLVWILSTLYRNRLPEIQALWPGGSVHDYLFENGEIMYTSYLVAGK